jgi:hypothetical protein
MVVPDLGKQRSIRSSRVETIVGQSPTTSHVMFSALPTVTVGPQQVGPPHPGMLEESAIEDPFSQPSRTNGGNQEIVRDIFAERPSVSVASRDIFLPPRDIFGAAAARGLPATQETRGPLAPWSAMLDPMLPSSSVGLRETSIPPRSIFGTTDSMGTQNVPMAPRALDLSPQRVSRVLPTSVPVRTSPISGTQPEFYGVRKGFQVGVCDSWDELARRISGFPAPEFKTFTTCEDAKTYVMQGMWRDMPESARPWVNPVPDWALPKGGLQIDSGIRFANRNTPIAPHTAGHSGSVPVHQGSHTGTVRRDPHAMDNMAREPPPHMGSSEAGGGTKGHDKIKQSFKCPRFSGNPKDWKSWNKGFMRFLSIWDLDYVLNPTFFDELPLSVQKVNDNKMVYFI